MLDTNEIKKIIKENATPGCSICTIDNNKKETYSFGSFDGKGNKSVNANTVYDIASLTKLYTAAIILRLHENKDLEINDKCAKYSKIFKSSDLTILDLLTHKANFGIFLSEYRKDITNFPDNIFNINPKASRSNSAHYENLTYLHLGKIIEKISSLSIKENFENLFVELGLRNTYVGNNLQGIDCPPTEKINGKNYKNSTHDETARMLGGVAGNAGIFATAPDIAKFGRLWLENKIVSKDLTNMAFSNYSTEKRKGQGIGWWNRFSVGEQNFPNIYYHPGFTGCLLAINKESKKVYALTTNRTLYGRNNNEYKKLWNILLSAELNNNITMRKKDDFSR